MEIVAFQLPSQSAVPRFGAVVDSKYLLDFEAVCGGDRPPYANHWLDMDGRWFSAARDIHDRLAVDSTRIAHAAAQGWLVERADARLLAPVPRPGKIVCIGLNYRDHARESGAALPGEPIVFLKASSALAGPEDDLRLPVGGDKTDWEVELALVIGARAKYVSVEHAMKHVAGFVLHNDYSERGFQLERHGQWTKGKSADGFAPLGPFLATPDELPGFASVRLWLKVNGESKQEGNTADMIFDVPTLVSYVSQFMTLLPGDVISTGTPAGVGLGHKPPLYLRAGDVVEYGIEGLGQARQRILAAE
jgi:2-keto-4-pentenoate hydratase/2-oxohepta-3-ene-1,7-dioic acid hydratase in catechol pathway